MARRKQVSPMQRIPSGEVMQSPSDFQTTPYKSLNGHAPELRASLERKPPKASFGARSSRSEPGYLQLIVCVAGIYASL